jgi:transcriptional regulator with XRE-family HTH domain
MSRADLASRVKLSSQAISALENGTSKQPSFVVGLRLADILGVLPHELAGIPAPPPSRVPREADNAAVSVELTITGRPMIDTAHWRRQILEALDVIPGIHVEEWANRASTAPVTLEGKAEARVSPSLDEFLTRIARALENVDRRLRALEGERGDPKADAAG